ncbi:MAG: bifunctional ADP-heptose synthase [Chitinophagales bacterium]|nr:bifunctional ADP-heptose synthase [Chitinophagales bacterium]MDW8427688.1 bifunctional ADP-heptose synthase [Chitinophagales bacterium]
MELQNLKKQFRHQRIAVVGDVMLDRYLIGTVDRISPEAPVPVLHVEKITEHAGGAANVAVNLHSLGARVWLGGMVGPDEAAAKLYRLLRNHGIKDLFLFTNPEYTTAIKTRLMARNHQMLRYDQETTKSPSAKLEQQLLQKLFKSLESFQPQALIIQDYNKGLLTKTIIERIIDFCRKKGILSAVDPKRKNFFAYKKVDVFKPNLREVREALTLEDVPLTHDGLLMIHRQLRRRLQHRITLLTLAERGLFYADGRQAAWAAAHPRDVADVSGAGDTVIAVATLALSTGLLLDQAAQLANLCGGLVCEHAGVVPITWPMLERAWKSEIDYG